jgi:hypothetical protein
MNFFRQEHYYCISYDSGQQYVVLQLHLETEPCEDPGVVTVYEHPLGSKLAPDDLKKAVMESIDAANKEFGGNFHVWEIRYSIEAKDPQCTVTRIAARCGIERLIKVGVENYAGNSAGGAD